MPSEHQDLVRVLLDQGESYYVEFKSAWHFTAEGERQPRDRKLIARDIGEAVVAFANSDGGDLLVGVEDSGQITGVPYEDDKLLYLIQAPTRQVKDLDLGVRVHDISIDGHRVLLFRTAESSTVAVTAEGRCLWRKKATSEPVAPAEIERRRHEQRGDTRYESEPIPGATLEDLVFPELPRLTELLGRFNGDREALLRYWNLVEGRNGHLVLRRAALLLFAREPLRWHPNNRVRIRRILGDSPEFGATHRASDSEVSGPITALIDGSQRMLQQILTVQSRGNLLFAAAQVLPSEATDECIVNAVAHRNYAIEGLAIEVLVYTDRVEFHSPGTLPSPLTITELRQRRGAHRSRNPLIMRVLRDLGWALDQGEGMRRIFGAMSQVELHEPELEQRAGTFIVRLSTRSLHPEAVQALLAAYGPFGLQPRERKYVNALNTAGGMRSVDKIARDLSESFDATKRALTTLEERGIVWHAPKSRTYHLVQPLNVLHERFFRLLEEAGGTIDPHTLITLPDLQVLLKHPDARTTLEAAARLRDSGILEPDGSKRWRLGPSFREYLARRSA